jgi:histone-lysine N-methyltransferase SUV39H
MAEAMTNTLAGAMDQHMAETEMEVCDLRSGDLTTCNERLKVETKGLVQIECEDLTGDLKLGFIYISTSTVSKFAEEEIRKQPPLPEGCACENCDDQAKNRQCCFRKEELNRCPYDSQGRLRVKMGFIIVECSLYCACEKKCRNSVVSSGPTYRVAIYRTPDKGWGVKALEDIRKNSFICEYIGELITHKQAVGRSRTSSYIFDLDFENGSNCRFSIDSKKKGNFSRLINHSCDSNLKTHVVMDGTEQGIITRCAFFAKRHIRKGEELTIDYHQEIPKKKQKVERPGSKACLCGSVKCRKTIF